MYILFTQFFTEAGTSYPFTGIFGAWIGKEVLKRIKLSEGFLKKYSKEHNLMFFLDAKSTICKPEIHGPKLHRRDKEVQFFIILSHAREPLTRDARIYVPAVRLLLESMITAMQRVEIDTSRVERDIPVLLKAFTTGKQLIRVDDWELALLKEGKQPKKNKKQD